MKNSWYKKGIVFGIVILFIGMSITSSSGINLVKQSTKAILDGNILYVGGSGPGNYSTIQSAINAANHGDTVFVYDDSSPYYEQVSVNKAINLIGEDKNTTVIESNEPWGVIWIGWMGVNVSGFTIRLGIPPPDYSYCGIALWQGETCNISGNIITNTYYGISLDHTALARIYDNIITDNTCGIYAFSSSKNYIYQNNISKNEYGILLSFRGSHYFIYENIIWDNEIGISISTVEDASDNYIFLNNILYNQEGLLIRGRYSDPPEDNHIYQNNFIGNIQYNARITGLPGLNYWDDKGVGNYWDDYTGEDNDGNGIGDTSYIIEQVFWGKNKDNYPLMESYSGFDPDAPDAPTIDGPLSGKVGVEHNYTFVATDPNGDDVYYYITWGDGTYEEWNGPYASGETVTLSHTWDKKDTYPIIARAKDTNELIGPWETFIITMPRNKATDNMLFLRLLERFPIIQKILSFAQ